MQHKVCSAHNLHKSYDGFKGIHKVISAHNVQLSYDAFEGLLEPP